MSRARNLAGFGSAVTSVENPVNIRVGYVTAIAYYGDGSELTGTPGGLGTALSDNLSSPLNKIYYTNANLSIASTINVDPPQSASAAYTQYTDIVMQGDADLIVGDGDDFIPDILGIGTFVDMPGILAGGDGKVRAANYTDKLGSGAAYGPYGFVTPVGVAVTVGSGTSISSPATNTLALGTNGTEKLRITSAGLVGIGTANPTDTGGYGQALDITGGASGAAIYLRSANGDTGQIALGSGDLTIRTRQAEPIIFNTNNAERLRITSVGDVGIGTAIPVTAANYSSFSLANTSGAQIELKRTSNNTTHYIYSDGADNLNIAANYSGVSTGDLIFQVGGSTERARVTSGGEVQIDNGNLKFSTSGTGIDFSATADGTGTATSELLDDYEEGTFSPILGDYLGASTHTYSHQIGQYTKIGNTVYFNLRVSINTLGTTGSTLCVIRNLPFTVNTHSTSYMSANVTFVSGFDNNYVPKACVFRSNEPSMSLWKVTDQYYRIDNTIGPGRVTATSDIMVNGYYTVS